MNASVLGLLAVGFLAGPMAANAMLVSYGTAEVVSVRNCVAGASGCDDFVWPPVALVYAGLPGDVTSAASVSIAGYGAGAGSVSLSGTIGAPILHASASSEPGKRVSTNSVALQSYTYTGSAPTTRTFGGTLTYSQSLTGTYPPDLGSGISAVIDVFTTSSPTIDVGNTAESFFDALVSLGGLTDYFSLGFDQYTDASSTAVGLATLGVTVTLSPGQTIWVRAILQTPATNGGTVDASHTLITSWDNSAALTPAAAIPEPATLALVGAALAGVATTRKRRAMISGT